MRLLAQAHFGDVKIEKKRPNEVIGLGFGAAGPENPWLLNSTWWVEKLNRAANPTQTEFTAGYGTSSFCLACNVVITVETSVSPSIASGTAEVVLKNQSIVAQN